MLKIILLRTWTSNIGNAFIDMGAYINLKKAFPDSIIYEVSGYPNYLFEKNNPGIEFYYSDLLFFIKNLPKIYFYNRGKNSPYLNNCLNVGELLDADIAVFPGCTLYKHALNKYMNTLLKLRNKGIDIIFLGAGGGNYEISTQNYVKNCLKKNRTFGNYQQRFRIK